MADKIGSISADRTGGSYEKYMESPARSKTSNYNETVRANNKRIDSGQGEKTKRLPKGKTAGRQWKSSR